MTRRRKGYGTPSNSAAAASSSCSGASSVFADASNTSQASSSLDALLNFYATLATTVSSFSGSVDRILWQQNTLLLVLQYALIYGSHLDLVNMVNLCFSMIWFARRAVVQHLPLAHVPSQKRNRLVHWRLIMSISCLAMVMPIAVVFPRAYSLDKLFGVQLALFGIEAASLGTEYYSLTRWSPRLLPLLTALESLFLIFVLPTKSIMEPSWIYDHSTALLIGVTGALQAFLLVLSRFDLFAHEEAIVAASPLDESKCTSQGTDTATEEGCNGALGKRKKRKERQKQHAAPPASGLTLSKHESSNVDTTEPSETRDFSKLRSPTVVTFSKTRQHVKLLLCLQALLLLVLMCCTLMVYSWEITRYDQWVRELRRG